VQKFLPASKLYSIYHCCFTNHSPV
jgi:hypothetical protein